MAEHEANELRRRSQQGHGKAIITGELEDFRLVAVGNRLYYGKNQKTFIDFLNHYFTQTLDPAWGNRELKKPLEERHQILKWYDAVCRYQRDTIRTPGEITEIPLTGLIGAYFGLAYNLYLLEHNVELRDRLVRRLKSDRDFYGAYYETFIAAWFILAGFELTLEDEDDSSTTHCEFVATRNGRSFSVEAKTRETGKSNLYVGHQLYKALKKNARHTRIVFIDLNVADRLDENTIVTDIAGNILGKEEILTIDDQPAPPAYVMVTNQPYHLRLDDTDIPRFLLSEGFKLDGFGSRSGSHSLIDAFRRRQEHVDVYAVMRAFQDYRIPVTFDGEVPEFSFGAAERRLAIGESIDLPDGGTGIIVDGTVAETKKLAYVIARTEEGNQVMVSSELSDAELSAYRQHPATFFGQIREPVKNFDNPIDMFEFIHNTYRKTPREKILVWLKSAPDSEQLTELDDDELRLVYAERVTLSVINNAEANPAHVHDG